MDLHDLYTRYAADVHRFALYLSGNQALADDLTSETFLRAWSAASPIREATVKAYLFTIVRNLYLSEMARSSRRVELTQDVPSPSPGQHDRLDSSTRLREAVKALRELPELERAALLMRTQDGMPYEEIAEVLRISVANAKVKVHRARVKLAVLIPGAVQP
jgi:RNA polymerase sigma-70 factor (ECF subfamily)